VGICGEIRPQYDGHNAHTSMRQEKTIQSPKQPSRLFLEFDLNGLAVGGGGPLASTFAGLVCFGERAELPKGDPYMAGPTSRSLLSD
jgi:hypothetical protein